jgi:stearoyl-CoA desaturase (delta-9 desaturase)
MILIALGVGYAYNYQLGWFELLLFVSGYYISNITVGIALHRLWAHDTYKVNKYVEFILVLLSAGTLQGPALSWASNHFKHHAYTDTDQDPHTPLKYDNKLMGFWWSHMGWMLVGEGSYKSIDRVTMVKLGRNKLLRWQLKYYWSLAIIMNTAMPALVGFICVGTVKAAFAGFLFIGLGRVLQQQITFFVNSLCHFVGSQPYTKGTSRDIWWLALFLLGENWHNFHHAFPSDYRNGAKWYQLDVHKWIIYLLSKCGLAWDLKTTAKVRIEAKVKQTMEQGLKHNKETLESTYSKVSNLVATIQKKTVELENLSTTIPKEKFWKSLSWYQAKLDKLKIQLHEQMKNFENSSDLIIATISKEVKKAESSLQKLYREIEHKNINL